MCRVCLFEPTAFAIITSFLGMDLANRFHVATFLVVMFVFLGRVESGV